MRAINRQIWIAAGLFIVSTSKAYGAHPMLIAPRTSWAAMISSSTIRPWSDIKAAATTYITSPQATFPSGTGGFGTGNDSIRQQNENAFINLMGSYGLLYVLNSNNSGSITHRNSILALMDKWPAMQADQPVSDGYNQAVPMNGAFFNMTLAFDQIYEDLTPTQQSSYTVMMDSWIAYSRGQPSSWALSNYGAYSTYSIFRATSPAQVILDTQCYHSALLGNDLPYPPAICDARTAYRGMSSEIQPQAQLNVDGVSGSGPSYSWARIGGQAREKVGKWGAKYILNYTGTDTSYTTASQMSNFYEWLFAGMTTPWNTKVTFGDTANNQEVFEDSFQGLNSLYGRTVNLLPNAYASVGLFSSRAQRWANRSVALSTNSVVYPGELIDYVSVNSSDTTTSLPIVSVVVTHGGAAFWDDNQSTSALMGVLSNYHITKNDHYHAADFNGLFLAGYGELLLSNVGIGSTISGGVNGFPHYWHHDDAHSGNVVLIGNRNYAQDTGHDPDNSYNNWNPITPYVGNADSTPLYGGDGITESILGSGFDYAVGLGTSQYVFYSTTTGNVTQTLGQNNRNFIFVHPDTTTTLAPGYWIVADEVQSQSSPTVNVVWHPYGVSASTTTSNTEWAWLASTRTGVTNTYLNLFLGTPPASVSFSSSPFAATPATFSGSYINSTYNVDASSNARILTVLYPSNPTHTKATMAQIAPSGATGATISSGTAVDYVLVSSPSADVTQSGVTYNGKIGFFRKISGNTPSKYFVRQGTKFDDGAGTRSGFSSPVPVSLYMNSLSGSIVSTGTAVTFYTPNISGVKQDGVTLSGSQGSNTYTVTMSSGNHTVTLLTSIPAAAPGAFNIKGPVRLKGTEVVK